jgi:tripartite-type tricarboxylate transporter receptor subunit TctC
VQYHAGAGAGLPGKIWIGFLARAETPPAIVKRLADAIGESPKDREVAALIEKAQALLENLGPQEAAKFLADEERKWSEVAKVAKITN